jgi:ATP-dependent DNA helicase PIF1
MNSIDIILIMSLTDEQEEIFNAFMAGESMFITGPAGCGKSFLIHHIRTYCLENNINIGVTALTGAAAALIGGQTLHGWSGIGLAQESAEDIVSKIIKKPPMRLRWKKVSVLIIDEISMMSAELFNKLNSIAQNLRNDSGFYGGIQMIFCGDFAQLEPIGQGAKLAFKSTVWQKNLTEHTYYLYTIMRQANPVFQSILTDARLGYMSPENREILRARIITDVDDATIAIAERSESIKATILYPLKRDVNNINQTELQKLKKDAIGKTFAAVDYQIDRTKRISPLKQYQVY